MAVSKMWKVRIKIVPVIIRAVGTTEKELDQKPVGHIATEGHTNEHCTEHW